MKTNIITERNLLDDIIRKCKVCHIGMIDEEGMPYVLPFNFGYADGIIYLHSGNEGRKIEIFRKNPEVCISFCNEGGIYAQSPKMGCSHTMQFRSVLVFGSIEPVTDFDEKTNVMHHIMHQYTENREYSLGKPAVENVACYKVQIKTITGRQRGEVLNK